MPPPPDIDALSPPDLKSLVLELLDERAELRRTIGTLRDEIARLKGGPGRPDIKANVKTGQQAERHGKGERCDAGEPIWRAPTARPHAGEADDP
jgi:hypothetical protein